jgi:ATP/maltotriose-dependent transcriptional regulator MalT
VELLERGRFADMLDDALAEAVAGRGRLVLVEGEAGIGKTSLLRSFRARAHGRATVLWGACDPLSSPRALGPFLDVAAEWGDGLDRRLDDAAGPGDALRVLRPLLTSNRPVALVVEDAHWADEASLDVIGLLARRIDDARVLLVVSVRDDDPLQHEVSRTLLGELGALPATQRIRLPSLSLDAVRALAAPYGVDAEELHRLTSGNPFYATEVLASASDEIPQTVREAVLARATRAGPAARRLLDAAAVLGAAVPIELLETVAGDDLARLDDCVGCGMLTVDGNLVSFRHELARLAVAEEIPPHRRRLLHAAALGALSSSADAAVLAHHAEGAHDADAVLRYAPAAGGHLAAHGAHRDAAAQFARALRFSTSLRSEQRAGLLDRRAYECFLADQPDAAVEAYEDALGCYRAVGDRAGAGRTLIWLARLFAFCSRDAEAEAAAEAGIELLEGLPAERELARAYSTVANIRMLAGEQRDALESGQRAIELADRLGESEILAFALNTVGAVEFASGLDTGRAKLERSLELARAEGLTEHVARAYVNLASTAVDIGRYDIADDYLEAGLAYCSEHDILAWQWYLLAVRARSALERGRWRDARASAELALVYARPASFARLTALVVLARIRARRGEPDVWPLLDEAQQIAQMNGHLQLVGPVACARAEASWLDGAADRVDPETAEAVALAERLADPWIAGELVFWRRQAGIAGADADCATRFAVDERPYEAALLGAEAPDPRGAREALAALDELEAWRARDVVSRRLRRRGMRDLPRGPRPATRANPARLTPRELDVLALVAEGLRDSEIAAQLVVSPKTVGHHVSSILRKLDVPSRGAAREVAIRDGLTATAR